MLEYSYIGLRWAEYYMNKIDTSKESIILLQETIILHKETPTPNIVGVSYSHKVKLALCESSSNQM